MKKLFLISLSMVLVGVLVFSGCSKKEPQGPKVLRIGVIFGLTGPGSEHQLMERDVAQLCADWINEKGGVTVKGEKYRIELAVEDNKMSPAGSVDAATKLVHQEKVKFIIGCVVPVQVDGVASVTEKNKVLYVAVRTDIVHPDRPYSFTSNYGFAAPIPFLYEVLLEKYPGVKTVGQIIEDEPGARAVAELSQNIAKRRGLKMLEPQIHPWEAPEFFPQWTKILTQKPDAVDNGLKMPPETAGCIKQGRELGYKGPMFAAIPGDANLIMKMIGNKNFATDFIHPSLDPYGPDTTPLIKEIVKLWEKNHKDPFDADGPEAWDALWCIAQAIEKAQSLDPTDVKNAWEKMDTIETARGKARMGGAKTFGINHMVFNPCPVSILKDGKVQFVKWFDPWVP